MTLLLDTHVLLWWMTDDQRLPTRVRAAIAAPQTEVVVCAASTGEMSIQAALGTLSFPADLLDDLSAQG